MFLKKIYLSLLFLLFAGCGNYNTIKHTPSIVGNIVDNEAWYSDMKNDVRRVDVTIPVPNDFECIPYNDLTAPPHPCTLADINGDADGTDDYEPVLHVIMSANGFYPLNELPNATFKQKGKSTRKAKQKSYRIKLDSETILFHKERVLQLNKHPYDKTRVKNKLMFDLFRTVPNFPSLKTQFVNLWIDGVDYGLFTHVEKCGKEYLINRGWNKDDNLYKAQNFDFRITDALALNAKGRPLNPDAFDARLKVQRGKDQQRLITMLQAINRPQMSDKAFMKVFNKYFNRENYITWMALNIIVANKDTVSQNFFLLNPMYSNTFYFLPWDYDGASRETYKYAKWELGIGTWWGIPLHKHFLKIKQNRDDLDAMIKTIREKYISSAVIEQKIDIYKPLIQPYLSRAPDVKHLREKTWLTAIDGLVAQFKENIKNYESQKGAPMPFWQSAKYLNGTLTLQWDQAVDLEGDSIVYDLKIADNPDFNSSIINESNLSVSSGKISMDNWGSISYIKEIPLQSGKHYFMKVIAKEENNASSYQISFDKEVRVGRKHYFGVLEFTVE